MNMANTAKICWDQAWEEARKRLTPLKKGVETGDLQHWPSEKEIQTFASSPESNVPEKSSKLVDFLSAVHRYSPAFDVFIQPQPFLAAVAWGTCRFMVQALVSGIEFQGKIASASIELVRLFTRYKTDASIFSNHERVIDCVRALFTETIVFLVRAREYRFQSKPVRWCRAAFSTKFDDILKNIQNCVDTLERELNSAARQAQVYETGEQCDYRDKTKKQLQRIETHSRNIEKMLCHDSASSEIYPGSTGSELFVNWLGPSVFEGDYIPEAEPGTCDRIYHQQEWEDWTKQGYPTTLLLEGVQGAGKSVLARAITTKASKQCDRIVLSYFFRGSGGDKLTHAKSFATGVLWQLCCGHSITQCNELVPILRAFMPLVNTYKLAHDCPLERLLDLLSAILDVASPFLLVVDAINECATESTQLHQYLFDLGRKPHAQVIVTSRDQLLLQNGNDYTSRICLDQRLVEPDIAHFIEQKIQRNPNFNRLKNEISKTVLSHSQGIFLHARLLMDDLGTAKSVGEQKAKMARFASKVPEEYQRLFDEHSAKLRVTERRRRDEILQVLVAAKKLFSDQEVSLLLAFDHLTQTIDNEDIEFEPAEEITRLCQPLVRVSANRRVVFIHDSAKEFLLQRHLKKTESELFLARKCLAILTQKSYRDWRFAAHLLRKHILAGATYQTEPQASSEEVSLATYEEEPALYEYAVLHFQDHVTALPNPPEDVVAKLARFLNGIEFVVWSETIFDLRSQSGLGSHLAVYNKLLTWTKFLPAQIKVEVPIEDFYEMAHAHLSMVLGEESQDKLLPYLPQVRNAEYFNAAGQSADDWQKAYDNKMSIVRGFTEILGHENPLTLRFRALLLQEYFWKKLFLDALHEGLIISDLQRKMVGEESPDLYQTLWLLGEAYHCLTKFEEALITFKEAEDGLERLSDKPNRLYLMVGLYKGHTFEQLFRFDEAIALYDKISKELTPIVGEGNGFVLMSLTSVGAVQRKQGKYEQAERNLLEGWGGRKRLLSINVNVCLDAAVQLALLYRDRGQGDRCLQVLDAVSDSVVYQQDFERLCQTKHIRALVAFDNGAYDLPKLELLKLLHEASGPNRDKNNRELLWVRTTLAYVMRQHGDEDEAAMLFSDLVEPAGQDLGMLPEEPEPPIRLHIAEEALLLVKRARIAEADYLLRSHGLKWVRNEDFWILGQGGPVTDTGCMAPIGALATSPSA